MNELTIPPSPNWYEPAMLACSSDNTLIYGAWSDIIILKESEDPSLPAKFSIIPKAHSQKIISIGVNHQWGLSNKLIVSVGEENIVKVWNAVTLKKKIGHNAHIGHSKVVGAVFAGEERVVSVSEEGNIIVWNINTNEINALKNIFGFKVDITCISTCPHATWLTAFGLRNGLVLIADLRKNGKLIHKLRGHDKSVTSLAWCPAPVNIFPRVPINYVGIKKANLETNKTNSNEISNGSNGNKITNNSNIIDKIIINETSNIINTNSITNHNDLINTQIKETCLDSFNKNDVNNIELTGSLSDNNEVEINKNHDITAKPIINKTSDIDNDNKITNKTSLPDKYIINEISNSDHRNNTELTSKAITKENLNITEHNSVNKSELLNKLNKVEVIHKVDLRNEPILSDLSKLKNDNKISLETELILNDISKRNCNIDATENPSTNMNEDENKLKESDIAPYDILKRDCNIDPRENVGTVTENPPTYSKKDENILTVESEIILKDILKKDYNTNENIDVEKENPSTNLDENNASKIDIAEKENIEESYANQNQDSLKDNHNDSEKKYTNFKFVKEEISNEKSVTIAETDPEKSDQKTSNKIIIQEEDPRKEFLLASCSREGNIYIWRAGTDGRMQTFFSVSQFNKSNSRKNQFKTEKNWLTIFWATPTKLLSSSKNSELLQWTLPKPIKKSKQVTLIHNDHNSLIFNIVGPTILLNENNWINEPDINVWTFSNDRLLLNTDLGFRRTNLACYPTFGGSLECMQLSPLDPNRLAIGTGDGHIRIWDLSRPHINNINMTGFYNKIKGKVISLAWHPVNEMLLAFGTTEGRVGYIDTKGKMTNLYPQFFTKEAHKIEWGPIKGSTKKFGVYAVSEGKLVIFENNSKNECMEIDKPENSYLFTFSWKQDFSILLVITKSGCIITYSPDLEILSTYYCQPKMHDILWHPDAAGSCKNISTHCFWFANVQNYKKIVIYDLQILKSKENSQESIVAKYEGIFLITSFSWSPYDANQIVIATDAGIAMVWNIKSNKFISTFVYPNYEPILSVSWSPVDPDFVIVGGKDNNLNVWRISSNPPRDETEVSDVRRKMLHDIAKETSDLLPNRKEEKVNSDITIKHKKTKDNNFLPNFYIARTKQQGLEDMKKLIDWKEQTTDQAITNEIVDESYQPNLFDIFGSNSNMKNLVKMNENKHKEKGKYSSQIKLSLFHGDISTVIKDAIQEKRVTTQILTLAPMVSPKLWLEACETYANQLSQEADADPLETVTYYLACHKVHEAINVLCEATMYKEALALAKCRLMDDDETIPDIIEKWAKQFLFVGNYEMSAECYIFLGKYEDAVSVLFRRQNPEILQFAVELGKKCNNPELQKAILARLNAFMNVENEEVKNVNFSSKELDLETHAQNEDFPTRAEVILEAHTQIKHMDSNQNNILSGIDVKTVDTNSEQLDVHETILNNKQEQAELHLQIERNTLDHAIINENVSILDDKVILDHNEQITTEIIMSLGDLHNLDNITTKNDISK